MLNQDRVLFQRRILGLETLLKEGNQEEEKEKKIEEEKMGK